MALALVKLGGEVIDRPDFASLANDLAALERDGWSIVVSHGGGPQATALQERLGLKTEMIGGRRVTDGPTLDVMKMVVAGRLNVDLCAKLRAAGLQPLGLHGAVRAQKRPPRKIAGGPAEPVDLGLVGDVTGFDLDLLGMAIERGCVPVVACLGHDAQGATYNINADIVANELAIALRARALLLVTSTPGVLRDLGDPQSRIPRLTRREAERAIADGSVSKGMIPKLEESFAAIGRGIGEIHILSGDLRRALQEPGSVGTVLA